MIEWLASRRVAIGRRQLAHACVSRVMVGRLTSLSAVNRPCVTTRFGSSETTTVNVHVNVNVNVR
jgi:hypothetical protein